MKVNNINYRTVWMENNSVMLIEQNLLPFEFKIYESKNYQTTCNAIKTMIVRGAGAIGCAAGYAMAQAAAETPQNNYFQYITTAKTDIENSRPTAQNLFDAVKKVYEAALISPQKARSEAEAVADFDAFTSKKIGEFGNELIHNKANIATHCNAGWLAFVDYGTALSPIYCARDAGKEVFVYVNETRPRSQGARLTAWELSNENIPHTIIPDNASAYFMLLKKIDLMIVGADRIAANGDVANKIGTLSKALAAYNLGVPFYVAAPSTTFDFQCKTGSEIPIEFRNENEVLYQTGLSENGKITTIRVASPNSNALNPAFDVTPFQYITGYITEKGIIKNSKDKETDFSCLY